MRWSLVLSAFIAVQSALLLVCVALPVPPQSDGLERRGLKLPNYRENAKLHPDAYHVGGLGGKGGRKLTDKTTVTKERLPEGKKQRSEYAEKLLKSKNIHADHVFEAQMLDHHLKDLRKNHKIDFNHMDPKLKKSVKRILNGPNNMALVYGPINSSKGQMIKHGMQGKQIKRQPGRDQYALESYRTAHNTAKRLDKALNRHPGYSAAVGENTLRKKLHDTFVAAGLPPGSHKSQSKTRPSTPVAGPSKQSKAGPSTPPPQTGKRQVAVSPGSNSPKTHKKKKG